MSVHSLEQLVVITLLVLYCGCGKAWANHTSVNYLPHRYKRSDIEMLAEGTLPQRRVLDLAPGIGDVVGSDGKDHITRILERSLEY